MPALYRSWMMVAGFLALVCCAELHEGDTADTGDRSPTGRLGHPIGTYLTIGGVRAERGKGVSNTLLVQTVNGERLREPVGVWIDNLPDLPEATRCVLMGYESGKWIGTPPAVVKAEEMLEGQAPWQFYQYFVVSSVAEPPGLDIVR